MRNVCIHVGLHKTATTFLQSAVFPTLENTAYLSRPYTQLNHAFNKLQYADETRFNPQEIIQELSQFQNQNIFISDEMLSGVPNFNYVNRSVIAHRLKKLFPNGKIILFLRGQEDMILSLHNTWIKNIGGTRSIDSFLFFPSKNYTFDEFKPRELSPGEFGGDVSAYYFCHDRLSLNLSNFLYYEIVKLYKDLFGEVFVFLFEDFREHPEQIIGQLEEILGDRFSDLKSGQLSDRVNTSLNQAALEGKRFRNALEDLTRNRYFLKLGELGGRLAHTLLPQKTSNREKVRERIANFYRDNNQKLIQFCPEIPLEKYPQKYQL